MRISAMIPVPIISFAKRIEGSFFYEKLKSARHIARPHRVSSKVTNEYVYWYNYGYSKKI